MNTTAYHTLDALGIRLPDPVAPAAAFVPWTCAGDLLFLSGHIARRDGRPWTGRLGDTLATADGAAAARATAIDLLATLHAATGDLATVSRIVKLTVLVNSAPGFTEQHLVANGASELFLEVFGARGAHARSAFGASQIPFGSCVEIELIAQVARRA
ncbi:MAG TPA: RidA family protein [Vicinamibacterales bacterium]|nr:RidA family protein [Vicinamibacterales bacterium]